LQSFLVLATIATLYVYWTRTPQYTLLHVLDAYAKADHDAVAVFFENEQPRKKRFHVTQRTEDVTQHLTHLQNETLARVYGVTVEESRIDGKTATLRVKVGETAYRLIFRSKRTAAGNSWILETGRLFQNGRLSE
jgi:hypothetical protein